VVGAAIIELRKQFGGLTAETQIIRGHWQQQVEVYRDDLMRVVVDVVDSAENRSFFIGYKEELKAVSGKLISG
jgi:hypothetical protein